MAREPIDLRERLEAAMDVPVYTCDGHLLGAVKEAGERFFKMDAPGRLDYWLPNDTIGHFDADRITVTFAYNELDRHQVDGMTPTSS